MDSEILQVCIILSKLQKQSLKNPYFMKIFLKKYTSEYILQQTQKEGYTGNLLFTPNELIMRSTQH